MNNINLIAKYKALDKKYNAHKDNDYEYLVNFSKTKELPIHRWFYFVEGFSPKLVENIFKYLKLKLNSEICVLDPFSGSGTTLLTAKQLGVNSVGFEINPFSAFMIKTKTQNYSNKQIDAFQHFKLPNNKKLSNIYDKYELRIIKNLFNEDKFEQIELLKEKINKVTDKKVRDLLYLSLLTVLPIVSNYRKGGNGLKRKRVIKKTEVFKEFLLKISQVSEDLKISKQGSEPQINNDSCLNLGNYTIPEIDISLFSPPYANCFDPFEVYKTELWIGEFVKSYKELSEKRKMALTSNLNANLKKVYGNSHRTKLLEEILSNISQKKLWDKRIPKMLDTYFNDMYILLTELYKRTKKNGFCVIVVGNSAYGCLAVPTDILLGELGEKVGFKVKEIIIARRNETSSQQHAKLGEYMEYMRESLIILQK